MDAIPRDAALLLCTAIRQKNRRRWYTPAGLQCRGCTRFSKGNPDKMCFSRRDGYRGCNLVNQRYSQVMSDRE